MCHNNQLPWTFVLVYNTNSPKGRSKITKNFWKFYFVSLKQKWSVLFYKMKSVVFVIWKVRSWLGKWYNCICLVSIRWRRYWTMNKGWRQSQEAKLKIVGRWNISSWKLRLVSCCVFWPLNACLRIRSHGQKQWKTHNS